MHLCVAVVVILYAQQGIARRGQPAYLLLVVSHVFQPVKAEVVVVAFIHGLRIPCSSTDEPAVEHLENIGESCLIAIAVTMVVGIGMAHLRRVSHGIVGMSQSPVLAGFLPIVAATQLKRDIVTPIKFVVHAQVSAQRHGAIAIHTVVLCTVDNGILIGGVQASAVATAVGIAHISSSKHRKGFLNREIVAGREPEVFLTVPRLGSAHDVASGSKSLAAVTAPVIGIAPVEGGIEVFFPVLVLVFRLNAQACLLGSLQALRHHAGTPVALATRTTILVHIISITEHRDARVVVIIESEQSSQIAVVSACTRLDISQIATIILTLQLDIHHIVFLFYVMAYEFALLRRLVEYLQLFHRIIRQVVEHHTVLTFEEVLAIQGEIVNLLAIDIDVAIVLELCSGHLSDQAVEHRPFRQIKCRGIVDQRIATISQFHFRTRNDKAIEVDILEDVVIRALLLLHKHTRQLKRIVACDMAQLVGHTSILIARCSGLDNVVVNFGRSLEFVIGRRAPGPTGHCINDSRVLTHQSHERLNLGFGERVVDFTIEPYLTFLFFVIHRIILCESSQNCQHTEHNSCQCSHNFQAIFTL